MTNEAIPLQASSLIVTGMRCHACAQQIENALRAIDGIHQVSINVSNQQLQIKHLPELPLSTIVSSIREIGYDVAVDELVLTIHGLTAKTDSATLINTLQSLYGVLSVSVNTDNGCCARVQILRGIDTTASLQRALAELGCQITIHQNTSAPKAWREWIVGLLALPLIAPMLLSMIGIHWMLPAAWQFSMAAIIQGYGGISFYRGAYQSLRARTANMDVLVAMGSSAAFALSCYQWLSGVQQALYFEAAAAVIAFVLIGKKIEQQAKQKTNEAIRSLQRLRPRYATIIDEQQQEQRVSVEAIVLNQRVLVRAGDAIPIDGIIEQGSSHIDESMLSGESLAQSRHPGDNVMAGAMNQDGLLIIRASATAQTSTLAQMIRLVEQAQQGKAPIQYLVDRITHYFVPIVLLLALITYLSWLPYDATHALLYAISVLVIACPCALGLATPAAIVVGLGVAAKHGILIRNSAILQRAAQVDTVIFDKTGTLTEGKPTVIALSPYQISAQQLLQIAATLQQHSHHPLATAILTAAQEQAVALKSTHEHHYFAGLGHTAWLEQQQLAIGNRRLMQQLGVNLAPLESAVEDYVQRGYSIAWLARIAPDNQLLGAIICSDQLRTSARQAIETLHQQSINTLLLSGDHLAATQYIGNQLGISNVQAPLLPADKLAIIRQYQQNNHVVVMVGDGINDAPALTTADIGIAMKNSSDIAIHSADITLMRSDLSLVPATITLAQQIYKTIQQNLFWAFSYNSLGILIAAFGLLNPVLAGEAMALSSISVLGNALLLQRWRPPTAHLPAPPP